MAKTLDVIKDTIDRMYIEALCDGDCRRVDAFYWELGEVTKIEELEAKHEKQRSATRR